ncbi:MAG TPA: hypothetical protein PLO78_00595 [Candidatus Omnitrophota bacterium]|nr:hypothetical protein [Candidatus Omnitrophota bacterium]
MKIKKNLIFLIAIFLSIAIPAFAQEKARISSEAPVPNPYAEYFFAPSDQRLDNKINEVRGFSILKTPSRQQKAEYSIVTDFGGGVLKSRFLSGLKDIKEIDQYIKKNLKTAAYEGVEIRQLPIPDASGKTTELYWIGDKAYKTTGEATAEIASMKKSVQAKGGDFEKFVREAPVYVPVEPEPPVEIKTPAQFKKEEELILKFTDQMDIGEKLWGPFQGTPAGEPILWQSFGETSWRNTNLSENQYDSQVGYWTNRIVFKGIRFPLNTIDPFLESTINLDSTSTPYSNNLKLFAGLEWYPLRRNVWLQNYRPFGGIPILDWIRSYRTYIMYGNRYNIKNDIQGSKDYDLIWGVDIFYEWGIELPTLVEGRPEKFTDYLRQYVWGEYYGNYYVDKTNFGPEKSFNALIANSSVMVGIKLPGIPLPDNPINDEFALMPYLRFDATNNSEFSFWYQNQYFLAPGIRWMPFRCYRWKDNQWLFKTKVFAEWVGIGRAQRVKQDGDPNPKPPNYDLRFGINISSNRS